MQASPPVDSAEAIGSTRNSVVAYPMKPGERATLTFLAGEIDAAELKELAALAPNVKIIAGLNRQAALAHAGEAHAIDVRVLSPELIEKAPNLVWVQALSAGVDRYMQIKPLVENDRIILTNMRAVHGPAIADHAFAMLLSLTRNLRFYDAAQREGQWAERDTPAPSTSLHGKSMLVVGIGGIGEEIARRAHGFGMRVMATRRSDAPAPDFVERVGKPQDLLAMLPNADVVAVCVPLTAETENMFNEHAFAAMKDGSYLINIARGGIVNSDALLAALRSGKLAGACLDVTDPEPLPAGHALWNEATVIITPHVSGDAEVTEARHRLLRHENMRRFAAGEPLLNVVDKKAGY
jgi:phosphoglycerate dehydrogenase-like enzyme